MIETPRSQYGQIAELIRGRIQDGTYPAGSLLPSEDRLAEELRVSRVTVNRAVGLLRSSGDVKVRRGTGTVVRSLPRIHRDAQARYAARQEGSGAGEVEVGKLSLKSRTEYRQIGRTTTPPAVAQTLGLRKGEASLLRSRVLYANDEPTQIADSYLPWSITKDCKPLMQADAGKGGSYGRLAELGHGPVRFTEDVSIRMPSEKEQRTLDLDASQPVFEIWHVAYTAEDRPIEVCIHVMPGHVWTLRYGWDDQPASTGR
ncbi:GntR family transcriptional regulator [Micromonospora mirobrigensis]|uniref:GntR family transcriptional regulator n=1 Tax=Micromonospora mirobrigensis TaxID=262898 RepID=A0A1C4XHR3_9ACTN|nr:GntR family transcriptional regulator [Micromonospora mirobrigensis]SCF07832.1 GntR family transcriptional regulator [Micromonospora mirobrigensis]